MKRFFSLWIFLAGLFAVSCGTSYQTASSAYDDASYYRPGVTARVHLLATAQEAEDLKTKTLEQAGKEGTRVETVYTDPEGTVDIDVEPGTTYLIMNTQDDSYERKLQMFSDEPEDHFSLTINMNFSVDDWYYGSWYGPWGPWYSPWYSHWYSPWYGYRPYYYWGYHSPWYSPYWYHTWWYSPYWYHTGWYSHYWYPSYWHYDHYYPHYTTFRDRRSSENMGRSTQRRIVPDNRASSSNATRSGGSYRRVNPQINQLSGTKEERARESGSATEYRRVTRTANQSTGSGAVYRERTTGTESRTGQSATENTYYRRSSNVSRSTTSTATTTTNPGNSRSFYREGQRSSTTVNQRNQSSGTGSYVRRSSTATGSSTATRQSSSSGVRSSSSSFRSNVSSGTSSSSVSHSTRTGGTTGSTGTTRSSSGGSYRRR
ncbi:MAG: hypothetical protein GX877_06070 [Bacteroidales bacterium]|nr:hypothetical protein [Bacteroidales bacterium]